MPLVAEVAVMTMPLVAEVAVMTMPLVAEVAVAVMAEVAVLAEIRVAPTACLKGSSPRKRARGLSALMVATTIPSGRRPMRRRLELALLSYTGWSGTSLM